MLGGLYKKILNRMPAGVFVFDDKLRVLFTNAAFRRSFSDKAKGKGSLKEVLGCEESGEKCGEGASCVYCAFRAVMDAAVKEVAEKTETVSSTVRHTERTDKITMRIRILPADERGKLFLGLTDGTYQTEIAREMLSAQKMQRRLLPAGKSMGGVPYSYLYIPCLEIGGDLPDVYEWNHQTYGILSDVSGKGISAGMLSAFVKAGFNRKETSLARALSQLSGKFRELNLDERSYITVAAVRIDKNEGKIRYATAGHNAPILLKNGLGINEIESPAPPISNWMPDFVYEEREFPFEKGDVLVLLTDGVTECSNSAGELFGIERAESVLLQSRGAEDFIGKLKNALAVFSGGTFTDDITAMAFDL
ncbi:MAG: SpoIIE family protein phosphatase [Firmicutes bacterium]|nr:SpoIIE family protein phosphatase [Clostridia bacterium]MBS5021678.1 SpoIIE family protein phosphatase [Bacillota bacterium]